jgi:hypothetical protein
MIERGAISGQPGVPNGESPAEQSENGSLAVEQRLRRLEDAVAELQDVRPLEERIVERVYRRLNHDRGTTVGDSAGLIKTGGQLLPAALDLIRTKADDAERQHVHPAGNLRRSWLLVDAYAELRTMLRMFLDPRYRPSWSARIVPLALLVLIMTSWIWLPGTSILPTIMRIVDKIIDIALAFLAFKILHREARRYRERVADLPALPRGSMEE